MMDLRASVSKDETIDSINFRDRMFALIKSQHKFVDVIRKIVHSGDLYFSTYSPYRGDPVYISLKSVKNLRASVDDGVNLGNIGFEELDSKSLQDYTCYFCDETDESVMRLTPLDGSIGTISAHESCFIEVAESLFELMELYDSEIVVNTL